MARARSQTERRTIGAALALAALSIAPLTPFPALADPSDKRATLFSGGALLIADTVTPSGRQRSARGSGWEGPDPSAAIGDFALSGLTQPDLDREVFDGDTASTATFVHTEASNATLFTPEMIEKSAALEWESRVAAEQVFFYEGYSAGSKLLLRSDLRPLYDYAVRLGHDLREYTSLTLGRNSAGDVVFVDSSAHDPIVDFRIRASATGGVEPRVELGDHLSLRYNLLERNSLLEFRTEF